ncbi:DUF1127 domain-containing protein [Aliagarivorans marinus]|uniref:DUF1127 domain-containing protein n=1 Tax=Aliagarivorans marinus TaxID=561965 RepID=UPI0003FD7F68|nr:DUF1127 domain-containing protein [Aliagarivorans marinus]
MSVARKTAEQSREISFTNLIMDYLKQIQMAYRKQRSRRALARLSPHQLKDIGLSRADAINEASKPFWR